MDNTAAIHQAFISLKKHENFSKKIIVAENGNDAIGFNYDLERDPLAICDANLPRFKISGISEDEALMYLEEMAEKIANRFQAAYQWWFGINAVRQGALIDVAHGMGFEALQAEYEILKHIDNQNWRGAADRLFISPWGRENKSRALTLGLRIKTGKH